MFVLLPGCNTVDLVGFNRDERLEELTDTADVKGPLERMLAWTEKTDLEALRRNPDYYERGQEEFQQAARLYEEKKWEAAEKQLKAISKTYDNYAVKEDALYLLGEIYFQTKRYAKATDTFDTLVHRFPSSRYQPKISSRMFTIAGVWLDFPDVVKPSDIKLASNLENATEEIKVPAQKRDSWDPTLAVPVLPNLHDNTRPLFDTEGRALEALKSIWLNDPTSDLADDALMMTASHYLRKGDSVRADEYFAALRQNYPDSPHFKNSYILGSHVKLMSYEGADYDGTRLEEAKQLNESAMRMWPDDELKARLEQEQKAIRDAEARREWERVQFYRKKGRLDSAGIYCRELIRLYPDTPYAKQAEQFLAENPIPRKTNPVPQPAKKSGPEGWNWRLFPQLDKVPERDAPDDEDEETQDEPSRRFFPLPQESQPYDDTGRAKL